MSCDSKHSNVKLGHHHFSYFRDKLLLYPYITGLELYRSSRFSMANIKKDCFEDAGAMFFLFPSRGFGEVLRRAVCLASLCASGGVPVVLGAVLLTAAALKTHQLATIPTAESVLFTSRWFLVSFVEFELALGLWLLVGAYLPQARLAALAAFASFAVVSLYQALAGRVSCCCFGRIPFGPRYTLVFDLIAIAALWRWHPEEWNIRSVGGGGGHGACVHVPSVSRC